VGKGGECFFFFFFFAGVHDSETGGLTEACADGNRILIFSCRSLERERR